MEKEKRTAVPAKFDYSRKNKERRKKRKKETKKRKENMNRGYTKELFPPNDSSTKSTNIIPSSLMASMLVFHTGDPGSIPGLGNLF